MSPFCIYICSMKDLIKKIIQEELGGPVDLFFKPSYNANTKKTHGVYFLLDEDQNTMTVYNPQELEDFGKVWANGQRVYRIKEVTIKLPKKFVTRSQTPYEGKEGWFEFEIPYWLYSKEDGLKVKRIDAPKKPVIRDNSVIDKFKDPKYVNAFLGLGMPQEMIQNFILSRYPKPVEKYTPQPMDPDKIFGSDFRRSK